MHCTCTCMCMFNSNGVPTLVSVSPLMVSVELESNMIVWRTFNSSCPESTSPCRVDTIVSTLALKNQREKTKKKNMLNLPHLLVPPYSLDYRSAVKTKHNTTSVDTEVHNIIKLFYKHLHVTYMYMYYHTIKYCT